MGQYTKGIMKQIILRKLEELTSEYQSLLTASSDQESQLLSSELSSRLKRYDFGA